MLGVFVLLGWSAWRAGGFTAAVVVGACGLAAAGFVFFVIVLVFSPGEESAAWEWASGAALVCALFAATAGLLLIHRFLRPARTRGRSQHSPARRRGR